jgi:hypothetical protein
VDRVEEAIMSPRMALDAALIIPSGVYLYRVGDGP